jgi:DNA-binding CsgD family transcriptional regulator
LITRAILFERFAGRDEELNYLVEFRARSARDVGGGTVLIAGDAGVGKSRLLSEFEAAPGPPNSIFVRVRCEELAVAYAPLVRALELLGARRELRGSQEIALGIEALTTFAATTGHDSGERHRRQLEAVTAALSFAARRSGHLTLVVDDAHWSDHSSLEAMRAIAVAARKVPILLVVAYRPEVLASDPARALAFAAIEREGADRVALGPLPYGDIADLLRQHLPSASAAVLRRIYDLSEGKPYFAEELARSVVERGCESELEPTLSLRSAVLERAAQLPVEARHIIGIAAVLGRNFAPDDVRALGADPGQLARAFAAAMQLQLVEEREVDGVPWFRFRHALTREILYRAFLALERKALHAQIADYLDALGTRQAELAYHLSAAGMSERAVVANERAGDAALGIGAFADAGASYGRGLALAGDDVDAVARLGLKMAEALAFAGDLDEVLVSSDRTAQRLESAGRHDDALAIRLVAIRALAPTRLADASALLDRTRAAVRDETANELRFTLELLTSRIMRVQGRLDGADAAYARAEAVIPSPSPAQQSALALCRAYNDTRVTDLASVEQMLDLRLKRIASKESDPAAVEAETLATTAIISFRRGACRAAFAQSVEAAERLEQIGHKRWAMRSRCNAAFCAADIGDFAFVTRLTEECHRKGLEPGEPLVAARLRVLRATGGDAAPYLELVRRPDLQLTEYLRYMLARDLPWIVSHDPETARAIARSALETTPAGDYGGELVDTIVAFGDDADVARVLERFATVVVRSNDLKSKVEQLMVEARLAVRRHEPIEAARHARELAALARESGQWLLLAHALDILGERDAMRAELLRIGATAELERLERRAQRPAAGTATGTKLTLREQQIANLIAAGLSSREVALRLAIAARTVETHLANAYQKLGINSRAELVEHVEGAVRRAIS